MIAMFFVIMLDISIFSDRDVFPSVAHDIIVLKLKEKSWSDKDHQEHQSGPSAARTLIGK